MVFYTGEQDALPVPDIACGQLNNTMAQQVKNVVEPDAEDFRMQDGSRGLHILSNDVITVGISNYGGRLVFLFTRDKMGKLRNIVLGFDSMKAYKDAKDRYYGAIIGRVANRISGAKFRLDGRTHKLQANENGNVLHGGVAGFHEKMFKTLQSSDKEVTLACFSPHKEGGFPGNIELRTTYSLARSGELRISYRASSDRLTVANFTNHAYFNLNGAGSGSIAGHRLIIDAERYIPVDEHLIPVGNPDSVAGTPFDFREEHSIEERIEEEHPQLRNAKGYDHTFILKPHSEKWAPQTKVVSPESGIYLEVRTVEPGLHFYSGNNLDGTDIGREGKPFRFREAFSIQTQHFPDSPNRSNFPPIVLKPGQVFHSVSDFRFGLDGG